ncbi:MAG: putative Ig domain-containing protein, partial [Actinomycetota bacterium]|nr:putative Ig domain-containing protein [Actinomycetota bacterium]
MALTSTGRDTISFIIPAGQTAPNVTPKVYGVDFGSAAITAAAFGFDTVAQKVQVTANLSFFPAGVNIDPGTTKSLTLILSAVPPTGLTVNLSSDNTGVATVPASVTFSAGVGTVSVPVTGVGTGSALIHASALPNVPDTTASVTVGTPGTPVSITTTSLASAFVGTPYSQTLTATGGMAPYTFSLISGTLPAGLTLNSSTGQIAGTPTAAVVNAPLTFQVTDSTAPPQTATAAFTLTVSAPPGLAIATTSLANGSVNTPYSQTLTATGGKAPYTFALTSGTLPGGLTLNPATGLISGTPTAAATNASLTFQATDSTTPTAFSATKTLTITIGSGTVAITTTSLPEAVVNQPYNVTLNAAGGTTPYTWSIVSGRLPSGFQLDPSTGQISGTTAGVFDGIFTVQYRVTDSSPTPQTATASLTIIVGTGVLKITNTSLANGQVNAPYSQTLTATGGTGPLTFSVLPGSPLPNGLTLNAATGEISGTPTAPVSTLRVSFQVKDSSTTNPQTAQANLNLTITTGPPSITTTLLPAGTVGSAYSATVSAAGGTPPYTFSATGLPAGLSINSSGRITGTPTTAGTSPVSVTVKDSTTPTGQMATANLSITIASTQPTITAASLPAGTVGSAYSATVSATGGTPPYTFSATGLPAGLSINASGQISGTPATAGTSPVTVTLTDSTSPTHQTATANLSITIGATLAITTASLSAGTQGAAYSATVNATGGTQPYTFSATGLPAGLTINASGQISGTPTTAGTSPVTVTLTDSTSPTHQTATAN